MQVGARLSAAWLLQGNTMDGGVKMCFAQFHRWWPPGCGLGGVVIPPDTPFSLRVRSPVRVAIQYTRADTRYTALGMITGIVPIVEE
jgi:hypothetical protein